MWQRIQTLYLAIVVVLSTLQIFLPVAGVMDILNGEVYEYRLFHLINSTTGEVFLDSYFLPLLPAIIAVIALVTIFLFNKRLLQIRLCVINLVLALGYYGYLYYHLYVARENFEQASIYYSMPASFQLINFVLLIMAIRAIGKDEALIRAMDRIR
ncbi:MAG TPA: DUF4293 domain-containing protein [Bacteroidales bacterium]|jgi:hypothetical protein|nr:DUF4293 domain-containing protein [Bacteroidales bacterium]